MKHGRKGRTKSRRYQRSRKKKKRRAKKGRHEQIRIPAISAPMAGEGEGKKIKGSGSRTRRLKERGFKLNRGKRGEESRTKGHFEGGKRRRKKKFLNTTNTGRLKGRGGRKKEREEERISFEQFRGGKRHSSSSFDFHLAGKREKGKRDSRTREMTSAEIKGEIEEGRTPRHSPCHRLLFIET